MSKPFIALMFCAFSTVSNAFQVGNQLDEFRLGGGSYSDADSSNGAYFYSQTVADNFVLPFDPSGYVATDAQWYGLSEDFIDGDIVNVRGFEVSLFTSQGNLPMTLLVSKSLTKEEAQPTLVNSNLGNPVYSFSTTFDQAVDLGTGGQYWLQVGALLDDGQGDAFVWASGKLDDNYAAAKVGTPWSDWEELEDSSDVAFLVGGQVVPEPGQVPAVALGLVCFGAVGRQGSKKSDRCPKERRAKCRYSH